MAVRQVVWPMSVSQIASHCVDLASLAQPCPPMPNFNRPLAAICVLLLGLAIPPTRAAEPPNRIDNVKLDAQTQIGGQAVRLNGAGAFAPLKGFAWIKGYVAALYLAERAASTDQVLTMPGAKRLQMRMLMDVPVAEFVKAFHKGVARNAPAAEQPALADRMQRFDGLIQPLGKVLKGDAINLDYIPGRGMLLTHNGRELGAAIPGDDFYDALLGVFIGPHPVDDKLKALLLGQGA